MNPGCESCRELIASAREVSGVHVLSAASLEESRALAKDLGPNARVITPFGGALGARLQVYPQVFVIDRGEIVRVCRDIRECR